MTQGALAWLLSLNGVSVLLPGITSLDKTRECIEAAGMRLSDQEMAELDRLDDGLLRRLNLPW
jgi:aryl-alcohol dehydrogenase-like predicted oxidoreductase